MRGRLPRVLESVAPSPSSPLPRWLRPPAPASLPELASALRVPQWAVDGHLSRASAAARNQGDARALLALGCQAGGRRSLMRAGLVALGETRFTEGEGGGGVGQPDEAAARAVLGEIKARVRENRRRRGDLEGEDDDAAAVAFTPGEDPAWGRELIRRSAELGHVPAAMFLAEMPDTDQTDRVAWLEKAVKWAKESAKGTMHTSTGEDETDSRTQHAEALYALGSALYEDPARLREAVQAFRDAAQLHLPDALFFLGHLHRIGVVSSEGSVLVPVDSDKARQLILRAAELGDTGEAEVFLAKWAMEETEGDWAAANQTVVRLLLDASKKGNGEAMFLLADAHMTGDLGLPRDEARALTMYQTAGRHGCEEAWLSAGALCLRSAQPQVQARAYEMYSQAAQAGNAEAWRRIAALYAKGEGGVDADPDFAEKILKEVVVAAGSSFAKA